MTNMSDMSNEYESTTYSEGRYSGSAYGSRYGMERRNDLMSSFTDAVRENPMSAALIGMGALWLFFGGSNMTLLGGRGRKSLVGAVAHGAGDVAQGTANAASRMGSATVNAASRMSDAVTSTVSSAAESVSDAASRVGGFVAGSVHGVDAESAYRNPHMSQDDYDREGEGSSSWSMPEMSSMRGSMQDMFERHPIMLGVAGLALGAGVAASLPLTSTERETLGGVGEKVRSKVSEAAGQAKEMASAMADEVRQHGIGGNGNVSTQ